MKNQQKTLGGEIRAGLRGAAWIFLVAYTPFTAVSARNLFQHLSDPPYSNTESWQGDLEVEKRSLGLQGVVVKVNIEEKTFLDSFFTSSSAYTDKKGDGTYEITLKQARGRRALRHELYHVYEWEKGIWPSNKLGCLFAEWRAQNYIDGKIKP